MPDNRQSAEGVLAARIDAKINELFARLQREMQILAWPAEYRALMWSIIAGRAMHAAREAARAAA